LLSFYLAADPDDLHITNATICTWLNQHSWLHSLSVRACSGESNNCRCKDNVVFPTSVSGDCGILWCQECGWTKKIANWCQI